MMERVGAAVSDVLSRFGVSPALAPIVDAWPAAVGPDVARNAWPARVARDGTLHVHTSSAPWAFELRQLEAQVRAALGALAPSKLRFTVGPIPEPPAPSAPPQRVVSPAASELAQAQKLAAGIDDESLRKVVAKAAALGLARAAADRSL